MSNWILVGALTALVGCSSSEVAQNQQSATSGLADSKYVTASEPLGAVPVGEARQAVEDEKVIALVGRIGGSSAPFIDGMVAFSIVDPKVPYCSPDEGCPTPWDYCCTQDQVNGNIATVKIVDEFGAPVPGDARQILGVKELSTVVVEGTAKRDDQGNLTVAATKVFVRPGE